MEPLDFRPQPMTSVSIIIATSGRLPALRETLLSLGAAGVPADFSVELVLVENVARVGAEELLRAFPAGRFTAVKYLFEPARGKSNALNLALSQATGDILLFSDDDVRFPPNWVARMCEPILTGRADAVAGWVKLAPHLLRPWMNHTHRAWLASTADYLSPAAPSEMCGANMAVSRRVFDKIGDFDPELGPGITGGGEESLLSWQLQQAGFRLVAAPEVEVEHHPDPVRLLYPNWINAARLKGRARAYLLHHWHHRTLPCAWLKRPYFQLKLTLRRAVSSKRTAKDEGIAPWELSYVEDIATCTHYLRERRQRKHYDCHGRCQLNRDRHPVTS